MKNKCFKIVLLGTENCDKSLIISYLLFNKLIIPKNEINNIIYATYLKEIFIKNKNFKVRICDLTASYESFNIQKYVLFDADLIVLCVDENLQNFKQIENFIAIFKQIEMPVVLFIIKADLNETILNKKIISLINEQNFYKIIQISIKDKRKLKKILKFLVKIILYKPEILRTCCFY